MLTYQYICFLNSEHEKSNIYYLLFAFGIEYASMTVAVLVNIVPLGGEQKLRDLGVNIIGMINE